MNIFLSVSASIVLVETLFVFGVKHIMSLFDTITIQPNTVSIGVYATLENIRQVVREEVHKALHPEEERPFATVEYEQGGKKWRGKVYLVEDEDEEE